MKGLPLLNIQELVIGPGNVWVTSQLIHQTSEDTAVVVFRLTQTQQTMQPTARSQTRNKVATTKM